MKIKEKEMGEMSLTDHEFERIMICAAEANISDVHFHVDEPVFWRRYGELSPLKEYVPTAEDLWRIFVGMASEQQQEEYENGNDVDFSWCMEQWRYRVNVYRQRGKLSFAFRTIKRLIPDLEALGEAGKIKQFLNKRQGLIMITGATGSGKTTTMAAFINNLNENEDLHIVTMEDPVEYVYPKGKSIISQRELGRDFVSYEAALQSVLRQDPDVICVAELRNKKVAQLALDAAATGHLVITTMHTSSVDEAIARLESMFPPEQQPQVRNMMASVLIGVSAQRLMPNPKGGRFSAAEILVVNQPVKNLIRTGKYEQLASVMQSSFKDGMQTMEMSVENLGLAGND